MSKSLVREMASLTILSGKISSIQARNLKLYPLVMFDDVDSAEVSYDLGRDRESLSFLVEYRITAGLQTHLQRRLEALEKAVHDLFWKEIKVRIFLNGEQAFESKDVG